MTPQITMPKITMYTRPGCSDVARARAYLSQRGLHWTEIDIDADADACQQVMAWNGGRAATPTLWIGKVMLTEPDAAELDAALAQEAA